jgi:hypothetical protein
MQTLPSFLGLQLELRCAKRGKKSFKIFLGMGIYYALNRLPAIQPARAHARLNARVKELHSDEATNPKMQKENHLFHHPRERGKD